jgi:DnaJ like chaperone protein
MLAYRIPARKGRGPVMLYIAIVALGLAVFYVFYLQGGLAGKSGHLSGAELNSVQDLFFRTLFTLLGYVAKRDGPVNAKEVKRTQIFMDKMDLSAEHKREAIRLFKAGADPAFNVQKTLASFKGLAKKSPNLAQILLVYLINLAKVDGALVNQEVAAVEEVA